MSKGRRKKPYKDGARKQMTTAWKQHVLARLEENKKDGKKPANLAQLAAELDADKRGIYVTFDLEIEPQQMSSAYVDEICTVLEIPPPMLEASQDAELEEGLAIVRSMNPEDRRALLAIAARMLKR